MKSTISIACLALYLFSVVGLVVNIHFCHGEAESIQVLAEADCCCEDTQGIMSSCCEDKTVFIQMNNEHNHLKTSLQSLSLKSFEKLNQLVFDLKIVEKTEHCSVINLDALPPPDEQKIYLQTLSLLYYS